MTDEKIMSILKEFEQFPEVEAIAIGGSSASNTADKNSDIDVYVFVNKDISVEKRTEIVKKYSSKYETGCEYFGAGDEFWVNNAGVQLDVMYFNKQWFGDYFENVWIKHPLKAACRRFRNCLLYNFL